MMGIPGTDDENPVRIGTGMRIQYLERNPPGAAAPLQQTFSGLVFCHFLQSCDKEESEKLIAVMGESFYRLPLI